jgi:hypothetical protein
MAQRAVDGEGNAKPTVNLLNFSSAPVQLSLRSGRGAWD